MKINQYKININLDFVLEHQNFTDHHPKIKPRFAINDLRLHFQFFYLAYKTRLMPFTPSQGRGI